MARSAKGRMQAEVCRRGCRSQRQVTVVVVAGSSSRPKIVVRIPAMWIVLEETWGGGLGKVWETGLGVGAGMAEGEMEGWRQSR